MSDYVKQASKAGEKYLSAVTEGQESFLKYAAAYSEWISKVPTVPAPGYVSELPTPREIAEANFDFVNKLLAQQKAFADKLFASSVPAAPAS
jgi:hypothetical protein